MSILNPEIQPTHRLSNMNEVDNDENNRLKVGIGVFAAVTALAVFALVLFFFVRK